MPHKLVQVTNAEEDSLSASPSEGISSGSTPLKQIAAAKAARELGKSPEEQILATRQSLRASLLQLPALLS